MIRAARESDLDACAAILARSLLWDRYALLLSDAQTTILDGFRAGGKMWVYIQSGTVIGFVLCYPRRMFNQFGYIRLIAVAETHRGRGVGTQMLKFAEEKLFAESSMVFMMVSDFNIDAQRLYFRFGYEKVGAIPDYRKEGITEYILLKRRSV